MWSPLADLRILLAWLNHADSTVVVALAVCVAAGIFALRRNTLDGVQRVVVVTGRVLFLS